jgi:hypothetical protein
MEVSKAQAYRMYGRADVDRWIKKGLMSHQEYLQADTIQLFELPKTRKRPSKTIYSKVE